jgi:hypothetical protein
VSIGKDILKDMATLQQHALEPNITQKVPTLVKNRPRVIRLLRVSDIDQANDDKHGIPRQRSACIVAERVHDLEMIREVVVIDVSGRHVHDDPQFQGIFADLMSGAADGISLAEQSRLVRPEFPSDFAIFDYFMKYKRVIFTPGDRIDFNTKGGWYSGLIGGIIAGDELKTLYDRLVGAKQELRDEGKHAGGDHMLPRYVKFVRVRNPQNYRKIESSKFEYGPQSEVDKILHAATLVEGQTSWEDAARAVGMTGTGLKRALQNPILIGIRRYGWKCTGEEYYPEGRNGEKRKKRRKMVEMTKPQDVIIPELIGKNALMTQERFDRLQEIIAARKSSWMKSKLKNAGRARHLAPGITYCECGLKMYPRYGSRKSECDYYSCKSRHKGGPGCGRPGVIRNDLDFTIREMLIPQLRMADFLLEVLAIHEQSHASTQRGIEEAKRDAELAAVKAERQDAIDLRLKKIITDEDLKQRLAGYDQQIRILELAAKSPVADEFNPSNYVEGVSEYFADFAELQFSEQRDMLRRAVATIMIQAGAIVSVTLLGGWLGSCVNSQLQRTLQREIDTTRNVVLRFPQPIVITSIVAGEKLARKEVRKAATETRRESAEFKEAHLANRRARESKAGNPEVYKKKLATVAAFRRKQRAKFREENPEAYAALKAKNAAQVRAHRARRRAA